MIGGMIGLPAKGMKPTGRHQLHSFVTPGLQSSWWTPSLHVRATDSTSEAAVKPLNIGRDDEGKGSCWVMLLEHLPLDM